VPFLLYPSPLLQTDSNLNSPSLATGLTQAQGLTRTPLPYVIAWMSNTLATAVGLLLLTACLAEQHQLHAEDWPQWRGPERTGHVPKNARIPATLPASPRAEWRIEIGAGLASPVIAGGRVFYFDNQNDKETLHAIGANDGRELWRTPIADVFADEQGPSGPRCTPLVDGDRAYAQSGKGELQCLSVADGQVLWHINFMKNFGAAFLGEDSPVPGAAEHGYTAAPVIIGHRLIACVGGTNGAGVICFEKRTGKLLWKSQNDRAAYAAPMIATLAGIQQLVCFTVEGVIGLALDDGGLLWRIPLKTPYGRNCITPIISGDWVVAGSYRAGLIGIKVSGDLLARKLKAERIWTNKEVPMNFSSPVCVDRHIYGLGPARQLVCVEVETGRLTWADKGYVTTAAEMARASFLVMGPNILVLTDDGLLALIAADPTGCRELGRARVCGANWCNPAYADGRLYLRDGMKATGNLYCLELLPR
jgi:outer membrane protein assembly factor BamB